MGGLERGERGDRIYGEGSLWVSVACCGVAFVSMPDEHRGRCDIPISLHTRLFYTFLSDTLGRGGRRVIGTRALWIGYFPLPI